MHMVTETRQLRDGEKLTEFFNRIDWKPLFEFVRRYYGIGVEQPPTTCLKPNGRIDVNWPENLRDKCGLFGHTYREVYLQTFSSCCFHDITYDKDIVDKYLARPDFYRLNISLENDCNGTSSDAYLQLTFSLKHIEFSGGYNFASLFSAEYRKDTGWFVVSGEGYGREAGDYYPIMNFIRDAGEQLLIQDLENFDVKVMELASDDEVADFYCEHPHELFRAAYIKVSEKDTIGKCYSRLYVFCSGHEETFSDGSSFPVCDSHYVKAVKEGKEYKVPYPFDCNRFADELNKKFNEKERLTPAQRLFFWTEYKKPIE